MGRRSLASIIWGLGLIALGVGFLLSTLGVYNFGPLLKSYWPLVFVLVALAEAVSKRFISALFWVSLSLLLLTKTLNIYHFDFWPVFLSLVLVWIGLSIIFRSTPFERGREDFKAEEDSNDRVNATAVFGGVEKRLDSKDFRRATLTSVFGGTKIDLRHAEISERGAVIDVVAVFGGVEIVVPEGTPVRVDALALFGGSEDKTDHASITKENQGIVIKGTVVFGGVSIKN